MTVLQCVDAHRDSNAAAGQSAFAHEGVSDQGGDLVQRHMVALDARVLRAAHCRETLSVRELVRLTEQSHATDAAGVSRNLLTEYADALAEIELTLESQPEPGMDPEHFAFTRGIFEREPRAHTTDESTGVNETALYVFTDERISIYPPEWHEALVGTTDLADCVAFVDDATTFQGSDQRSTTGSGVPERALLGVATVIGALDPAAAESQLAEAKEQGQIIEVTERASNPILQLRAAADTASQSTAARRLIDIPVISPEGYPDPLAEILEKSYDCHYIQL